MPTRGYVQSLSINADIKPQNILLDTPAIKEMFEKAPSQVFMPQLAPLQPPSDFYRQSEQLSSGEEDLAQTTDLSIKLADFGAGTDPCSFLPNPLYMLLTVVCHGQQVCAIGT